MKRLLTTLVLSQAFLITATRSANATPITFAGASGPLKATAVLGVQGTNLIVVLPNLGNDALSAAEVLTSLVFDMSLFDARLLGNQVSQEVSEPSALILMGLGLVMLLGAAARRLTRR